MLISHHDLDLREEFAELKEQLGDYANAVIQRKAIMILEPPDPVAAQYQLARAELLGGDAKAAHQSILETLEDAPLYDEALELLLDVRRKLGHEDQFNDNESNLNNEEDTRDN